MDKSAKTHQQNVDSGAIREPAAVSRSPAEGPIAGVLRLQRTVGNKAVGALLNGGRAGKYRIGPAGDVYEREADRVADQIMRMPEPTVQRAPT
jgi:hypothetical protein